MGDARIAVAVVLALALVGLVFAGSERRGAISGFPLGFFVFAQLSPMALAILGFWLAGRNEDDR